MTALEKQFHNKCHFLDDNFFSQLCPGKTVLEVGSFEGAVTEWIAKNNPSKLTLLEANEISVQILEQKFPRALVIHGDMHYDLAQAGSVDVALMLGVIYHSHAPLLVMEELVNACDPTHIVIDNMSIALGWHEELPNTPGMRYTTKKKKTCDVVININDDIILAAFNNLGYTLVKQTQYPDDARAPGMSIFHFTKQEHL